MRLRPFVLALLPIALSSCLGDRSTTTTFPLVPIESTTFAASLGVNLAASTKTPSGLYYREITVGTGATIVAGTALNVKYSGALANGSVFDSGTFPFTIPGNVIQGWNEGLLGMKNGKSLIPGGENRYHAIFSSGPAQFVSASSLAPALIALGAKFKLVSASGNREVAAEKFFVAPENENTREIVLAPNEILTEILIPAAKGVKNATYEVRQKEALDWPLATASVALTMKGSTVASARIVLGHVGPVPYSASAAEKWLAGKTITESVADEAGKAAVADAKPLSQNEYKVQLARVAVKRALLEAAAKKA